MNLSGNLKYSPTQVVDLSAVGFDDDFFASCFVDEDRGFIYKFITSVSKTVGTVTPGSFRICRYDLNMENEEIWNTVDTYPAYEYKQDYRQNNQPYYDQVSGNFAFPCYVSDAITGGTSGTGYFSRFVLVNIDQENLSNSTFSVLCSYKNKLQQGISRQIYVLYYNSATQKLFYQFGQANQVGLNNTEYAKVDIQTDTVETLVTGSDEPVLDGGLNGFNFNEKSEILTAIITNLPDGFSSKLVQLDFKTGSILKVSSNALNGCGYVSQNGSKCMQVLSDKIIYTFNTTSLNGVITPPFELYKIYTVAFDLDLNVIEIISDSDPLFTGNQYMTVVNDSVWGFMLGGLDFYKLSSIQSTKDLPLLSGDLGLNLNYSESVDGIACTIHVDEVNSYIYLIYGSAYSTGGFYNNLTIKRHNLLGSFIDEIVFDFSNYRIASALIMPIFQDGKILMPLNVVSATGPNAGTSNGNGYSVCTVNLNISDITLSTIDNIVIDPALWVNPTAFFRTSSAFAFVNNIMYWIKGDEATDPNSYQEIYSTDFSTGVTTVLYTSTTNAWCLYPKYNFSENCVYFITRPSGIRRIDKFDLNTNTLSTIIDVIDNTRGRIHQVDDNSITTINRISNRLRLTKYSKADSSVISIIESENIVPDTYDYASIETKIVTLTINEIQNYSLNQQTKNQPLLSGDVGLIRTAYADLGAGYSGRRIFVDELSNVFYLYYNEPSVGLNNTPHLGVGVQSCFLEKFNLYTKERLNRWELTDMRVATSGSTFHVPYFNLEQNEMYVVASAQDAYTGETSPTATLSNYPLGATSRFFKVSLLDGSYIDLGRVLVSRAADERTVCILGFNNVKNECYFSLSINNASQNLYKTSITNSTTEEYEFSLTNSQPPNLINYNERTDVSHFKIIRNSNNIIASFDFSSMSLIKTSTIVSKWGGASITTSYKPYYENFNKDAFTIVIKQGGTIELVTMNEDFEIIDSIESSSFYYNYGDFCIGSFSKKVYSIFFIVYAFVEDTLKQINKK